MVQIFEKTKLGRKDILILVPEEEELIDEKVEQILKKKIFHRYSKSHEKKINIDKLKSKIDTNIYRGRLFLR